MAQFGSCAKTPSVTKHGRELFEKSTTDRTRMMIALMDCIRLLSINYRTEESSDEEHHPRAVMRLAREVLNVVTSKHCRKLIEIVKQRNTTFFDFDFLGESADNPLAIFAASAPVTCGKPHCIARGTHVAYSAQGALRN